MEAEVCEDELLYNCEQTEYVGKEHHADVLGLYRGAGDLGVAGVHVTKLLLLLASHDVAVYCHGDMDWQRAAQVLERGPWVYKPHFKLIRKYYNS